MRIHALCVWYGRSGVNFVCFTFFLFHSFAVARGVWPVHRSRNEEKEPNIVCAIYLGKILLFLELMLSCVPFKGLLMNCLST